MDNPKCLLLIDDNPGDLRLIQEVIEDTDHEVSLHTARRKREALELLHPQNEHDDCLRPDIVLLDWNLGDGTGRDVLEEAGESLTTATVVIMGSVEPQVEELQSEGPQVNDYFTKPPTAEEYRDLIRPLLD